MTRLKPHMQTSGSSTMSVVPAPGAVSISKRPVEQLDPLAHARAARALAVERGAGSKPPPSSSIITCTLVALRVTTTLTWFAPACLTAFVERLLHDAVERGLDIRREGARRRASSRPARRARRPRAPSRPRRRSAGSRPKSSSADGRSSTASRRTLWSVSTTRLAQLAGGSMGLLGGLRRSRPRRGRAGSTSAPARSRRAARGRAASAPPPAPAPRGAARRAARCLRSRSPPPPGRRAA